MANSLCLFRLYNISSSSKVTLTHYNSTHLICRSNQGKEPFGQLIHTLKSISLPSLFTTTLPFFLDTKDALAVGGQFGILEGRLVALIHPFVMGGLFAYMLRVGYLGWQWRRVRTIRDEINELKKEVKPVLVAPDGSPPPDPIQARIQCLTEERKKLLKGNFREKHLNAGSILLALGVFESVAILLALGVFESVAGCLNSWLRTGKLFLGPHLFAGAAMAVLLAVAAALVPAMQKGNETARNLHIALNVVNVALFVCQIPTGFDILLKVLESTKWP